MTKNPAYSFYSFFLPWPTPIMSERGYKVEGREALGYGHSPEAALAAWRGDLASLPRETPAGLDVFFDAAQEDHQGAALAYLASTICDALPAEALRVLSEKAARRAERITAGNIPAPDEADRVTAWETAALLSSLATPAE